MIKKLLILILFTVWCKNLNAALLCNYETFTLKNGSQFILLENKRANVLSLTSSVAVAQEYARYLSFGLEPNIAEMLRQEAEKVTLEGMDAFAHEFLAPELSTFSFIKPSPKNKTLRQKT